MRTDSVKKYVIPNIPYLFILWACLKLGTAYRLAPGADFAHKLMGLGQSIGPAFADFAPGLAPFDWLIGIVGAVGFRLLIYFKSKNAKKFRRDEEYGSARWGTEKDIKPFVDPKFENNVILTKTEFLTMNTRPKNPANARNLNACIIGSSGSGKTRFWLTPQLLQAHSSYVCVDPKGGVLSQVGAFLQRRGYQVKVFNSIDFSKSMHYNPLSYIHNEADILKFVDTLIANTKGEGKEGDPFWTKAETLLYCALIAYIIFEAPAEDRNINTLVDMISGMDVKEDDESYMNAVDYMFKGLEKRKPDCFAVKQYKKYKLASGDIGSSMTSFALLWQKTGFFSKRLAFAFSTVFASKAASSGLLGAGSAAGIVAGGMVTAAGCGAGVCSAWGAAGNVGGCSTWGVAVSGAGTACWGTWNGLASGAAAPLDVPVPKISLISRPSSALIS